jgi:uncharacterized protein
VKIAVTGSTGLVGEALVAALQSSGHEVVRVVRSTPGPGRVVWDPEAGTIDAAGLQGIDGAVHLAGENIASGRWTAARKKRIRDSRVNGTRLFCETLADLQPKPRILVSASAIGFYGERGAQELTESDPPGKGFLPGVCREWEAATMPAADRGIRVVLPRIAAVLSPKGGALAKMLPPFKLCLGGKLGSGAQYMSWITLDDLVRVILFALEHADLDGAVNASSPNPVTNARFTKALGKALGRPTIFPMPGFVATALFGEMAQDLLLASTRVVPTRLLAEGFEFSHANIDTALDALLR